MLKDDQDPKYHPPRDPDPFGIANNEIEVGRKLWQPGVQNEYIEPNPAPNILEDMELLHKKYGKSLRKKRVPLPPRNDIILFDPENDQAELEKNIRWKDCPDEHKGRLLQIIKDHWDVFAEAGLRKPIRGFECRIDTGECKPVCCRPPR